jgi:hypothetical protein
VVREDAQRVAAEAGACHVDDGGSRPIAEGGGPFGAGVDDEGLAAALNLTAHQAFGGVGLAIAGGARADEAGVVVTAGGAGQVDEYGAVQGVGFVEAEQHAGGVADLR